MCGIFGIYIKDPNVLHRDFQAMLIRDLLELSESRGKEAAGIAVYGSQGIQVYKEGIPANKFVRTKHYKKFIKNNILTTSNFSSNGQQPLPTVVIGHSRLVTNGSMEIHENNQPVISAGLVGIHNGIIVNDEKLWQTFPSLTRQYQVDTEVVLSLIRKFYCETESLESAVQRAFHQIQGTASVAVLFDDIDAMVLATNNGSLFVCATPDGSARIFASEMHILQKLLMRPYLKGVINSGAISQVRPNCGWLIDLSTGMASELSLGRRSPQPPTKFIVHSGRPIMDLRPTTSVLSKENKSVKEFTTLPTSFFKRFEIDLAPIQVLRRCTRCILPETMPFIEFDEQGVCNYCRNHQSIKVHGLKALTEYVGRYRKANGYADCLVTFSGGRDSSYGVHFVKNVLNMNPIAYTYDWGMVTDLARRNQARLCGKLGVEHILISADIRRKREFIRKNVIAWLKRPDLGTVPLFMAGDKQYFYFANQLQRQLKIDLTFICINPFERTNFKTGFCGVRQPFNETSNYALSVVNQAKLAAYYGKQYILNPSYLNASIPDTLGAFFSFYLTPHHYLNLFKYIYWNEEEINTTLIQEYEWEVARDTRSTWRIGDGTASFYNYIYYMGAGFTENDTFRSNQIREGIISREEAIELVTRENQPRFDSIQWYCNTIGIDIINTLEKIIQMPKRYEI